MINEKSKLIWEYLKYKGYSDYAVAGILGNIYAESKCNANNLQSNGNRVLDISDEEFTEKLNTGKYDNFEKDGFGYGLCQWTWHSRKRSLQIYMNQCGVSMDNTFAQLDFMIAEINGYSAVKKVLVNSKNVQEISDTFMCQFERPLDQSVTAKSKRADYALKFFNAYSNNENVDTDDLFTIAQEVIKGKWGNGVDRKERLSEAGYDYKEVQTLVNTILKGKE